MRRRLASVRQDARRRRAGRVRGRGRRPALAGRAGRAAHAARARRRRAATSRCEWIEAGRARRRRRARARPRPGAPRTPPARRASVASARPARRWLGPLELSNEPADDWPAFYAERRLRRSRGWRASAARCRARRAGAWSACASASPSWPARRSRRRGCTAICGRATCSPTRTARPWLIDPSAYGGHREVDLAMLALFGSPSARVFDSYEEVAPLADGLAGARRALPAAAAARARAAVRRLLPRLGRAHGPALRLSAAARAARRAAGALRRRVPRAGCVPSRGRRSEWRRAAQTLDAAGGCTCSRASSSRATTAAG